MKIFLTIAVFITLAFNALPAGAVVRDSAPSSPPMTFSDGANVTTFDHCGDADLCANISYPNGDSLQIFSEGAALCQPYLLHFVRTHGPTTLYEYTRVLNHDGVTTNILGTHCGNNQATQMTLDRGYVHLTVDEYNDGSLRFIFSPTVKTN
jgi:hypothetical protein